MRHDEIYKSTFSHHVFVQHALCFVAGMVDHGPTGSPPSTRRLWSRLRWPRKVEQVDLPRDPGPGPDAFRPECVLEARTGQNAPATASAKPTFLRLVPELLPSRVLARELPR